MSLSEKPNSLATTSDAQSNCATNPRFRNSGSDPENWRSLAWRCNAGDLSTLNQGCLAKQGAGLVFAQLSDLHQQPFGTVYHLTLSGAGPSCLQLGTHRREQLKT